MISDNPTRTRGIEKAWRREIARRFKAFQRTVLLELTRINQQNELVINSFKMDPVQLRAYIAYFELQIDALLLGDWQDQYQLRSYQLAVSRAMAELRLSGGRLTITDADRLLAAQIESFSATSSLGLSAVDISRFPIHQETLSFLFNRSFESFEGYTDAMKRQVRQILFDGVEQGLGIREIARRIKKRIGVAQSGARLIAQTETIQAYQRGTINQAQIMSELLGEPVTLRWITRRDGKVRPLHVGFHGKVMTQKQARRSISISPYNCRCALIAIIKEFDTPKKQEKFARERTELQALTPKPI